MTVGELREKMKGIPDYVEVEAYDAEDGEWNSNADRYIRFIFYPCGKAE